MTTLSRRSLLTFGLVAGTGLAVTACSPPVSYTHLTLPTILLV